MGAEHKFNDKTCILYKNLTNGRIDKRSGTTISVRNVDLMIVIFNSLVVIPIMPYLKYLTYPFRLSITFCISHLIFSLIFSLNQINFNRQFHCQVIHHLMLCCHFIILCVIHIYFILFWIITFTTNQQ